MSSVFEPQAGILPPSMPCGSPSCLYVPSSRGPRLHLQNEEKTERLDRFLVYYEPCSSPQTQCCFSGNKCVAPFSPPHRRRDVKTNGFIPA